ncbi:MAG: alpha/beta fold hydrolase [Candidatus Eremiobacteraeota bacterium]|nr:alpha/beta fold hydrolase [Candidatus Eremiobacteraeota bacterium]
MRIDAAVAALLTLLGAAPASGAAARLDAAAQSYYADIGAIAKVTSRDSAIDYYQRLIDDKELLSDPPPGDYTPAMWQYSVENIIRLDTSLANQLRARQFQSMAAIRGLDEAFVRSSRDGTMEPVAVYVPSSYVPGKPTPLVVFLHGRPQSESQLLAPKFLADLAERIGSIVVAPYGRGYYDFIGSEADVYDAYDAALQAFTIDPRKKFLVGYSMGGFSVFNVAPVHPDHWSAVMSIAGSLLGSRAARVVRTLSKTPFYVLTGSADDSIPTQYPTATAIYLRDQGVPVTFYSLPGGKHRLFTLLPILTQAWDDMLHGTVRTPTIVGGSSLPTRPPPAGLRP